MTAQTILPANTLSSGYDVDNSLRFDDGSSDYLNLTCGGGSRQTWTLSMWVKRGTLGTEQCLFSTYVHANDEFKINFYDTDKVGMRFYNGSEFQLEPNRLFRDASAWYHLVFVADNTNSTEANRFRIYVNGVRETSFAAEDQPSVNLQMSINDSNVQQIGRYRTSAYFDGYMAEVRFIDNQALTAASFGEFDEDSGIWKPKDVSDLTSGTNGFYLDFEDSSALGNDAVGSNNFTSNNLTAVDQSTDTCTNNFATLNPINNFYAEATLSNGNLDITTDNSNECFNTSTLGASSGKWYMEVKIVTTTSSIRFYSGVTYRNPDATSDWLGNNFYSWGYRSPDGKLYNEQSEVYTGATLADGDIIGIAMDLDNHKLYTHKAGTYNNSGDPTSGSTGTGAAALDSGETYFFAVGDTGAVAAGSVNFGSPSFAISSGNSDARGHGNFEYAVPSGYFALCTKNLAEFG